MASRALSTASEIVCPTKSSCASVTSVPGPPWAKNQQEENCFYPLTLLSRFPRHEYDMNPDRTGIQIRHLDHAGHFFDAFSQHGCQGLGVPCFLSDRFELRLKIIFRRALVEEVASGQVQDRDTLWGILRHHPILRNHTWSGCMAYPYPTPSMPIQPMSLY